MILADHWRRQRIFKILNSSSKCFFLITGRVYLFLQKVSILKGTSTLLTKEKILELRVNLAARFWFGTLVLDNVLSFSGPLSWIQHKTFFTATKGKNISACMKSVLLVSFIADYYLLLNARKPFQVHIGAIIRIVLYKLSKVGVPQISFAKRKTAIQWI